MKKTEPPSAYDRMCLQIFKEDFKDFCESEKPSPKLATAFAEHVVRERRWTRYGYPRDVPAMNMAGDLTGMIDAGDIG